jgi:hypothetical protein
VFLFSLDAPKPTKALHALVVEAVEGAGGRLLPREVKGSYWEDIEAEDGSRFEWTGPDPRKPRDSEEGGGMAALRGFGLPVCRCLYAIAAKTDWVIVAAMEDARTLRAKESRALPLLEGMPELLVIGSPEELWTYLGSGYGAWKAYVDQVVRARK